MGMSCKDGSHRRICQSHGKLLGIASAVTKQTGGLPDVAIWGLRLACERVLRPLCGWLRTHRISHSHAHRLGTIAQGCTCDRPLLQKGQLLRAAAGPICSRNRWGLCCPKGCVWCNTCTPRAAAARKLLSVVAAGWPSSSLLQHVSSPYLYHVGKPAAVV